MLLVGCRCEAVDLLPGLLDEGGRREGEEPGGVARGGGVWVGGRVTLVLLVRIGREGEVEAREMKRFARAMEKWTIASLSQQLATDVGRSLPINPLNT